MSTASNLLNMNVTAEDASGNTVSGPVSSISIANGMATLTVNGTSVPFSNITSISPAGARLPPRAKQDDASRHLSLPDGGVSNRRMPAP